MRLGHLRSKWAPTPDYCPEGSYVYGYKLAPIQNNKQPKKYRINKQTNLYSTNKQTLGAVKFFCYSHYNHTRDIKSSHSTLGPWSPTVFLCNNLNDPLVGFSIRKHSGKPSLNLNEVKFHCMSEQRTNVDVTTSRMCPEGFAIAGLRTGLEMKKNMKWSGITGLEIACLPYRKDGLGSEIYL